MISLLFVLLFILVSRIGLYGIFQKAGIEGWKAFVPVLGTLNWLEIIGRPSWRIMLCFIPVVNLFIYAGMAIETALSFGRREFQDHFMAVVANPYTFLQYGFSDDNRYNGKGWLLEQEKPTVKPQWRQWTESIIFAVFAASFIRMFLIEAYTIPTSSMESSLLVGDFLFVSKAHYGIRTPNTPLQLPLIHNMIPRTRTESYLKWPQWKNYRLPAIQKVKRLDPVVFNVPEGDTIAWIKSNKTSIQEAKSRGFTEHSLATRNYYYSYKRRYGKKWTKENFDLKYRPIDKRDNYIKRCVGIPGDTLKSDDKVLFVNGKKLETAKNIQFEYYLSIPSEWATPQKGKILSVKGWKVLVKNLHINPSDFNKGPLKENDKIVVLENGNIIYNVYLNEKQIKQIKNDSRLKVLEENKNVISKDPGLYPHNVTLYGDWTKNTFGPVYLPAEGQTIKLNTHNLPLYKRAIEVYENNELKVKGGEIFINGEKVTSYTFKQGYYWMMGDNRDGSEDSRYFGMVPHDHIVGKPLFIWMSRGDHGGDNFLKVRWNRLFTGCHKMD